jgi:ATP-binding cassette subfamily F protein uup
MTPVKALSGGERNRVLLAKLFTQPTNFLVLDEPTNDLDIEMLEVLEEKLVEYTGTLIIVSHDRQFLDNVVTSVLVFEDIDNIQEYLGAYTDWENRGKELKITDHQKNNLKQIEKISNPSNFKTAEKKISRKLSYKLKRELDMLPAIIEKLERDLAELQNETNRSDFYLKPYTETKPLLDALNEKQKALDLASERWIELEVSE